MFYPGGFTNDTALAGSSYIVPAATDRILSLSNGALVLSGGNLAESLTNSFILAAGGRITNTGPHKLTLKFTPATGLFSGTLVPTNTTTTLKFNGAYQTVNPTLNYAISFRARWLTGSPRLQTRLYFNRLAKQHLLTIPDNNGTPGALPFLAPVTLS